MVNHYYRYFQFAFPSNSDKPASSVQRVILFLLLLFLPSAALADGMAIPTITAHYSWLAMTPKEESNRSKASS